MIKLKVRIVSERTKEPIKGIRVLIYENDKKIFIEAFTNHYGIVETRTYLTKDTNIFITVRGYSNTITYKVIIGPNKNLNMDIAINNDIMDNDDSVLQYFKKSIKEKYARFYRR